MNEEFGVKYRFQPYPRNLKQNLKTLEFKSVAYKIVVIELGANAICTKSNLKVSGVIVSVILGMPNWKYWMKIM